MLRRLAGRGRRRWAWHGRSVLALGLALPELGCDRAPAQDILGSFFPAWLLCAAIGVVVAAICHRLLALAGLNDSLIAPPLTYLALAVAVTLLVWLAWFAG